MNNKKRFIFNGLLLTAVSLLIRGVGVSFNAYISNKIGAEAMGLFTLISTVYGFAITFATSGINLAATRLVSEALDVVETNGIGFSSQKNDTVRRVMRKCVSYALLFSSAAFVALFFGADTIGVFILNDKRAVPSLKLLALTLPCISVSSALGGYFNAVRRVYKNALTQICEQAVKITVCTLLLSFIFADSAESGCICIVIGSTVAEIASFLLHALLYLLEKKHTENTKPVNDKYIRHKLLSVALPVAFSAYIRSALISIEHILIPRGLEQSGASRERALAAYGTLHSMVFPIVFFPSAILSSFSSLLIPEVTRVKSAQKERRLDEIINTVFDTAILFSIGCAGIMIFFSFEIGNVIYPQTDAGLYIKMIAPLIPIMYIDTSVDAILKGLGEQVYSMGVNIVDSLLSVILVIILLPRYGITGYIITVYFTEFINASLSMTRLLSVTSFKPYVIKSVIKPLACVICASFIIKYLSETLRISYPSGAVGLTARITFASLIYAGLLILSGSLKVNKKSKKNLEIRDDL